jgi:DNA-binding GntR family transcriptional regulator
MSEPRNHQEPSLVEDIADAIHSAVLNGDIRIGTWLRQEALAESFGVSRGPVREALRILEARRVIEVLRNRGARVLGPTVRESADAYVLRAELEGFAAERAATGIGAAELLELASAIDQQRAELPRLRMLRPEEGEVGFARNPWHVADVRFHRIIVRASGLEHLYDIVEGLRRFWPCHLSWGAASVPGRLEENLNEHNAILATLERRDGEGARRLMEQHHRKNGRYIAEWMQARYERLEAESAADTSGLARETAERTSTSVLTASARSSMSDRG